MYKLIFCMVFSCGMVSGNAQSYAEAESAEYDPINNQWLVSNGHDIIADDGQGSLSIFGTSSAGFGMEIIGNIVFGATQTSIVGVDLDTEEEVLSYIIPGATFINGLTNDGVSTLYATDFANKKIYKIDVSDINNPSSEVIVENTISNPNGILYDGDNNRLIYLTWDVNGKVKSIDLDDFSSTLINTLSVGFLDGIVEDKDGNYYISTWVPASIGKYSEDFELLGYLDIPDLDNPADIGYNADEEILAIPMKDRVVFVSVEEGIVDVNDLDKSQLDFKVIQSGNNEMSFIEVSLVDSDFIKIDIFDMNGKLIRKLTDQRLDQGNHQFQLNSEWFSSGMYIGVLTNGSGKHFSQKIMIH